MRQELIKIKYRMNIKIIKLIGLCILFFVGCGKDDSIPDEPLSVDVENFDCSEDTRLTVQIETIINPTGYAPLSAMVSLQANKSIRVDMRILGRNGEDSDVIKNFPETGSTIEIPVHGLYPDYENEVELTFFDINDTQLCSAMLKVQTDPLISDMPQIQIDKAERAQMTTGMTLVNYYGYDQDINPFRPFMFDSYGDIRWYLDFKSSPILNNLHFDDGPHRLANGNFFFGNNEPDAIYEVDLFGNIVDTWEMPGFRFHHEVLEKPNGNFIVSVDKIGITTIEDYIIEIDRDSKEIIRIWDLNESLDNTRTTLTQNREDWIHVNAVSYDQSDDTIIISGRTQGVVKLSATNEVICIIAPHREWNIAGNGEDLNQFLLQPLDATGAPITDQSILDGFQNHSDFEWNWYQHAARVLADGTITLFDNGDNRNFTTFGPYSRAVRYKIDQNNKTIQQIWEYGKDRGSEIYSRIVSDVDYLEDTNHMLISPGAIVTGSQPMGKSIEVDIATNTIIFEASIIPPNAFANQITFHRTDRLSLYPD